MRVALISYEFPPSVAVGGIGTYTWEASQMLASSGESVHVFCAGESGPEPAEEFGVRVHRTGAKERKCFPQAVAELFADEHASRAFDVMESPEIGVEGSMIADAFPEVARVVKLHTPSYVIGNLTWEEPNVLAKARFVLGGIRRGRLSIPKKRIYSAANDAECYWCNSADEVAAPSEAIAHAVGREWELDEDKVSTFPLPFRAAAELTSVPPPDGANTIGFLGRLEPRKGILELLEAMRLVVRQRPDTRLRLMGPDWPYRDGTMVEWLQRRYVDILHAMDFVGEIKPADLPGELTACDIVALPSRWESFGLACVESMAAGRAVVGSRAGGMAEIIEEGKSGLLVSPYSPEELAQTLLQLLGNPKEVRRLGGEARQRIAEYLTPSRILPLQLESYSRAIQRATIRLNG